MGNTTNTWILVILAILVVINLGVAYFNAPEQIDTEKLAADVAKQIVIPEAPVVDQTAIDAQLAALSEEVNEEDNFKIEVLDLATAEYSLKGNKAVFNAINDYCTEKIEDKDDIASITEEDNSVRRIDVEDGDAIVFQEIKVKYENSDGDNKKCYLDIRTVVEDNEVDDQVIELH